MFLQVKPPSGNGNVIYEYNGNGKLRKVTSGDFQSKYEYTQGKLLSSVTHTQEGKGWSKTVIVHDWIPDKIERNVRLREIRNEFDPKSGLASAKFDYASDFTMSKLK